MGKSVKDNSSRKIQGNVREGKDDEVREGKVRECEVREIGR